MDYFGKNFGGVASIELKTQLTHFKAILLNKKIH